MQDNTRLAQLEKEKFKTVGGQTTLAIADTYGEMAVKVTTSGSITYVGMAAPGSAQASAVWQCKKIDETSGTVITWANGSTSFNNVATNLAALTYS